MKLPFAAVIVSLVTAACASGPPHGPPSRWGGADADRGGPGGSGPRGPQLFISPSGKPFRAPTDAPYPVAAWFAEADRDPDGQLTRDEFRADADAFFEVADADHSGEIDLNEVSAYERLIVPEITRDEMRATGRGGRGGPPDGRGGGRRSRGEGFEALLTGAAPYSLINQAHPIRGADSDLSMRVSRVEWRAAADRRFRLLDKDGDGVVRLADLALTPMQRRAQGARGRS